MKGITPMSPAGGIAPIAFAAKKQYVMPPTTIVDHWEGCKFLLETIEINSFILSNTMIKRKTEKTFCPSSAEPTIAITKKTAVSDRVAKLFTFKFEN